ncbi:MAG: c-type cytochrome [Balneolaceae bacterium]
MRLVNQLTTILLLLVAATLVSCRGQVSEKPPVQLQRNMMHQDRFNAQDENTFFEDGRVMRMPVEGTVARGQLQEDIGYYQGVNEDGSFIEENPVPLTKELLYRGQDRYDIYCSVCHGGTGSGNGVIMEGGYGYVPAPTYHQDRIRNMPDGELYSAIYNGVRTMPSYRSQVPVKDRWAIVAYIRALQESQYQQEEQMQEFDIDLAALQAAHAQEQEQQAALEEERTASDEEGGEVSAEIGQQLFTSQGCQACHSIDGSPGVGPSLEGVFGGEVEFTDGSTATADEDYLYSSITTPSERVPAGYSPVMPPFSHLSDDQIQSLIEYIKTLSDN